MQDTKKPCGGFSILRSTTSACCGYLLCGVLLIAGAYATYKSMIPEHLTDAYCFGAILVSSLLATFFAAGKGGRRIVGSLCSGILLYLMFLLTGEFLGGTFDGSLGLIIAVIVLLACVIGAVLSGLIRR